MPFIRFRDCTCPETPHSGRSTEWGDLDGDVVEIRPYLDFSAGAQALQAILACDGDDTRLFEFVYPVYIRSGVLRWNVVDENGPVPCTIEAREALPFGDAFEIGAGAAAVYGESVLAPLLRRTGASSPSTTTESKPKASSRTRTGRQRS